MAWEYAGEILSNFPADKFQRFNVSVCGEL